MKGLKFPFSIAATSMGIEELEAFLSEKASSGLAAPANDERHFHPGIIILSARRKLGRRHAYTNGLIAELKVTAKNVKSRNQCIASQEHFVHIFMM